jgi:hypothetical protein
MSSPHPGPGLGPGAYRTPQGSVHRVESILPLGTPLEQGALTVASIHQARFGALGPSWSLDRDLAEIASPLFGPGREPPRSRPGPTLGANMTTPGPAPFSGPARDRPRAVAPSGS